MTRPVESLKDLLVTATVGTFNATSGWGIFISKMPESNDQAVVLYEAPGQSPNPRWRVDYPAVQIRVRGNPGDSNGAFTKAQAVKDALLGIPSQDINGDRLVSVTMMGDIVPMGWDESNRPEFSLNFSLIIEPGSGTNRLSL